MEESKMLNIKSEDVVIKNTSKEDIVIAEQKLATEEKFAEMFAEE